VPLSACAQIGPTHEALVNLTALVSDHDGERGLLPAMKSNVVGGAQPPGLGRLEHQGESESEAFDRGRRQAVANPLDRLVGKTLGGMGFGFRTRNHIDRFAFLLEGPDHLRNESLAMPGEKHGRDGCWSATGWVAPPEAPRSLTTGIASLWQPHHLVAAAAVQGCPVVRLTVPGLPLIKRCQGWTDDMTRQRDWCPEVG
jgi:hypothetical protein